MVIAEVITLASVVVSIFTSIWGLFKRKEAQTASGKLDAVAEGLVIIEQAIDENKAAIKKVGNKAKNGAGDKIVASIKDYGDEAKAVVNLARDLAHEVEDARE